LAEVATCAAVSVAKKRTATKANRPRVSGLGRWSICQLKCGRDAYGRSKPASVPKSENAGAAAGRGNQSEPSAMMKIVGVNPSTPRFSRRAIRLPRALKILTATKMVEVPGFEFGCPLLMGLTNVPIRHS